MRFVLMIATLSFIGYMLPWLGGKCPFGLHSSGADPGFGERGGGMINIFTTGGGYGRGCAPSRDSKGGLGER